MKYAWNITNVSDLRAKPSHDSERVSQLFYSEVVEIIKGQGTFVKIRQADGYEGWVYKAYLRELIKKEAVNFWKLIKSVIVSKSIKSYDNNGKLIHPYNILYGTTLTIKNKRDGISKIILPSGDSVYIKGNRYRPIDYKDKHKIAGIQVIKEAIKFLGIPYLWGGITPLGYDCSGLVQMVYRSFGIILPRDTKDQIKAGKPVTKECIKTGDLLFFNRHVGLAIGKTKLIHASRHAGGIRVESLVKEEENFREDLANTFVEARRII